MPVENAVYVSFVITALALFALTLAYANWRTGSSH